MLIEGKHYRSIQLSEGGTSVEILDQRYLPFEVRIESIESYRQMERAIRDMHLRGAPLIGAAAAFGAWLACREFSRDGRGAAEAGSYFERAVQRAMDELASARPTAVNLRWALDRVAAVIRRKSGTAEKSAAALAEAQAIADEDVEICSALGREGARLIRELHQRSPDRPVRVLTHCNAGWLATVDLGTVTAALYEASRQGIPLHVWVDETRPRCQGSLTAWELSQNAIENTVVCDNAGGHLMQQHLVDAVIVGTDRTAANGDAANKIGTYLKALAARDNDVPFYVALPSTSFDPSIRAGVGGIPIEERDPSEVLKVRGWADGRWSSVDLYAGGTRAVNFAFDVTPSRLITGFITEKGVFRPEELLTGLAGGAGSSSRDCADEP